MDGVDLPELTYIFGGNSKSINLSPHMEALGCINPHEEPPGNLHFNDPFISLPSGGVATFRSSWKSDQPEFQLDTRYTQHG